MPFSGLGSGAGLGVLDPLREGIEQGLVLYVCMCVCVYFSEILHSGGKEGGRECE